MKFSKKQIDALFDEARKAVLAGAEVLKRYFRRDYAVAYKGAIDPVTTADKETENLIMRRLGKKFPAIKFLCEESCPKDIREGTFWILDPMDGTVNFVHGFPLFSTSLALFSDGKIVLGIVNDVMRGEMFWSVAGRGAFTDRRRLAASSVGRLNRALLVTGFPYNIKERHERVIKNFKKLVLSSQGIRRLGSAALDMAYVADGRLDGFWEEGLAPWDVAAGSLIVREAGGRVSDFDGKDDWLFGRTLVASNSALHRKIIKTLNS